MTATSEKQKQKHNGTPKADDLRPPVTLTPRGRRRPGLLMAGVAMAALGALTVMWLVSSVGDRSAVVLVARDVPYGAALSAEDLTTTSAALDSTVAVVAADDADAFVGMVAATDLAAGTLLSPASVTAGGVIGPGEVLVPLPLTSDRVPAGGLSSGDELLVIDAPPPGADPVPGAPASFTARVVRVGQPDVNGTVVADVVTTATDGPAVATRAATGRFAIVVVPAEVSP